jgi:hypothetical protein
MSAPRCRQCPTPLSASQRKRGIVHCSRRCAGRSRRRPRLGDPRTHCAKAGCHRALTAAQRRLRQDFCSIRCAIQARHPARPGRPRTTCAYGPCNAPLTRRQQWRRRECCSRNCAKAKYWQQHPEGLRRMTEASQGKIRAAYVVRLRERLRACPDNGTAFDYGVHNGRRVAWRRCRAAGWIHLPGTRLTRELFAPDRAAAGAPGISRGEAFRRGYAAGYQRGAAQWAPPSEGKRAA